MFYIRLLHAPRFEPPSNDPHNKKVVALTITVAICNDLGEQRFSPSGPVKMTLTIKSSRPGLQDIILKIGDDDSFFWGPNMWIRKVEPRFPIAEARKLFSGGRKVWVTVDVADFKLAIKHAAHLIPKKGEKIPGSALIFPVHCECYWGPPNPEEKDQDVVRHLILLESSESLSGKSLIVHTADDIGDSIARHVWDSGIAMMAFFADLCLRSEKESSQADFFPTVKAILQQKNLSVLELGAGVCSQGIGLGSVLSLLQANKDVTILLTDVAMAQRRAEVNLDRVRKSGLIAPYVSLNYEVLNWEDGSRSNFGPMAGSRGWNLILVSDCTYNHDSSSILIDTFSALRHLNARYMPGMSTHILLSTKQRHESETIFFDMIKEAGWITREQNRIPFPVAEYTVEEEMEIYLFEMIGANDMT